METNNGNQKPNISWEVIGSFLTLLAIIAQGYPVATLPCIVIGFLVFIVALFYQPRQAIFGGGIAAILVILQAIIPGVIDNVVFFIGSIIVTLIKSPFQIIVNFFRERRFSKPKFDQPTSFEKKTLLLIMFSNFLGGIGLILLGVKSWRSYIYPVAFFVAILGYSLWPLDIDWRYFGTDWLPDDLANTTGFVSLIVYMISFIDTWFTYRISKNINYKEALVEKNKKKSISKVLLSHLFLGFGLIVLGIKSWRSYVYPLALLGTVFAYSLWPIDIDWKYFGKDWLPDQLVTAICFFNFTIYLIGFFDSLIVYHREKHH